MSLRIKLREENFADGSSRELVVNVSLIYAIVGLAPFLAPGTIIKMRGGHVHVQESPYEIKWLIRHAERHGSATSADLPVNPDEELFATSTLPAPVYARNRINSRPDDLTLNGVDLRYLIEQHTRMLAEIRAEALGA